MSGNANSGNRTTRRHTPVTVRVRLVDANAKRLAAQFINKDDVEMVVNRIIREWLDLHYPEPPPQP